MSCGVGVFLSVLCRVGGLFVLVVVGGLWASASSSGIWGGRVVRVFVV